MNIVLGSETGALSWVPTSVGAASHSVPEAERLELIHQCSFLHSCRREAVRGYPVQDPMLGIQTEKSMDPLSRGLHFRGKTDNYPSFKGPPSSAVCLTPFPSFPSGHPHFQPQSLQQPPTSCSHQFYPFPPAFQILLQTRDQPDLSKQNLCHHSA